MTENAAIFRNCKCVIQFFFLIESACMHLIAFTRTTDSMNNEKNNLI